MFRSLREQLLATVVVEVAGPLMAGVSGMDCTVNERLPGAHHMC